jgi:hypothetical protein
MELLKVPAASLRLFSNCTTTFNSLQKSFTKISIIKNCILCFILRTKFFFGQMFCKYEMFHKWKMSNLGVFPKYLKTTQHSSVLPQGEFPFISFLRWKTVIVIHSILKKSQNYLFTNNLKHFNTGWVHS